MCTPVGKVGNLILFYSKVDWKNAPYRILQKVDEVQTDIKVSIINILLPAGSGEHVAMWVAGDKWKGSIYKTAWIDVSWVNIIYHWSC